MIQNDLNRGSRNYTSWVETLTHHEVRAYNTGFQDEFSHLFEQFKSEFPLPGFFTGGDCCIETFSKQIRIESHRKSRVWTKWTVLRQLICGSLLKMFILLARHWFHLAAGPKRQCCIESRQDVQHDQHADKADSEHLKTQYDSGKILNKIGGVIFGGTKCGRSVSYTLKQHCSTTWIHWWNLNMV